MNFVKHSSYKGRHAMFSPSQSSWIRYDDEKIIDKVNSAHRTELGTLFHSVAEKQIKLNDKISNTKEVKKLTRGLIFDLYYDQKEETMTKYGEELLSALNYIPDEVFKTVKSYVNDGIGFRMKTEQPLIFSDDIFGTADSIMFRNNFLRIHDLKTGSAPAHMEQLEIYAALFCLEYRVKPEDIEVELRIYQNDEILFHKPEPIDILAVMDRITYIGKLIGDDTLKED